MTKKTKTKSRILEAVHETASDLSRLVFIDKRKMRKFDALCLDPVPAYDSEKIRALRDHLQLSQSVLAAVLNTSLFAIGVTNIIGGNELLEQVNVPKFVRYLSNNLKVLYIEEVGIEFGQYNGINE